MCLHRTQKNMDDTYRLDCRPGEWKSRRFPGLFCGSSVKTHDNHRPSVVASWIGTPVLDEVLSPSDRGERSETFSLGGEGYPRGIAKGDAPLASFLPYLSRSKDRVGGSGGRSAPVGRAGRSPATVEGRRSRP